MRHGRLILATILSTGAVALGVFLTSKAAAAKKKNPDDFTQTHELAKDPPQVAIGETRRLVFHVSPLIGKGLLSQQARDALKAILKANGGIPVVHLRAFVAGSGDVRRIPQIVTEVFGEKRLPLPSVSLVRAGALPMENAQVVFEAISVSRRDVNPAGIDFIAGDAVGDADPASPSMPLLQRAMTSLAAKLRGQSALAVSCFVSNVNNPAELSAAMASRFPAAASSLVQTQRGPYHALAVCEAVARGERVNPERLAFTGTRVAFGAEEKDATLAFQRLDRDLAEASAPPAGIVYSHIYPLSGPVGDLALRLRHSTTPIVVVPFEGLASNDAGFAVDAVAAVSGTAVPQP